MSKVYFDLCKLKRQFSNSELSRLWIDFYAGDMDARDKLIVGYMYLINKVIYSLISDVSKADLQELFSVGEIGLINAVDNFDISLNVQFSTYAFTCIRNEIVSFLRGKHNFESLTLQDDYEYEYNHIIGYRNSCFHEFIEDPDNIEDCYDDKDLLIKLYESFDKLDDNCKKALRLYYGFNGNEQHLVREVADIMKITYGQARHLIEKGIKKLKEMLVEQGYSSANVTNIRQYCKKYF